MRAAAVVLGLLQAIVCSGCGFSSKQTAPIDGDSPDAASDASVGDGPSPDGPPPDGPGNDPCVSFSRRVDTCALVLMGNLTVSQSATYSTDTHELRVNGNPVPVTRATVTTVVVDSDSDPLDAILVHDLTIKANVVLRVTGNQLPLAIIASGTVTIEGNSVIDLSDGGAGALATCANSPPTSGTTSDDGAGGGGGGSYGAAGGDGGNGNLEGPQVAGGLGGKSVAMPAGLRGGCSGANGGQGSGPGSGGAIGLGGRGGGALFIVAANLVNLGSNTVLNAGGGGGRGGTQGSSPSSGNAGGGGGGSGGMIALEAPMIRGPSARIVANGGGGGEGSTLLAAGNPGLPGTTTRAAAPGGAGGSTDGADGAPGGAFNPDAGAKALFVQPGGGGGGGGGVGYIHIVSPDAMLGLNVSPTPIRTP